MPEFLQQRSLQFQKKVKAYSNDLKEQVKAKDKKLNEIGYKEYIKEQ